MAKKVNAWYEDGLLPSSLLQQLLELQHESLTAKDEAQRVRYRSILHYQAHRNLSSTAQQPVLAWVNRLIDRNVSDPGASWAAIGFAARYATLARGEQGKVGE